MSGSRRILPEWSKSFLNSIDKFDEISGISDFDVRIFGKNQEIYS